MQLKKILLLLFVIMTMSMSLQPLFAADSYKTVHLNEKFWVSIQGHCNYDVEYLYNYRTDYVVHDPFEFFKYSFVANKCGETVVVDEGLIWDNYIHITIIE